MRVEDRDPLRWENWRGSHAIASRFAATFEGEWLPGSVQLELETHDGRVGCVGITVTARDGSPITARALRAIPLDSFMRMATHCLLSPVEATAEGRVINRTRPKAPPRALAYPERKRRVTDDYLREVAAIYTAAQASEQPPTRAVETEHSQAPISYKTAARWVHLARERGYLAAN